MKAQISKRMVDLEALAMLTLVRLGLSVFGHKRIRPWVARLASRDGAAVPSPMVCGSVSRMARFIPRATCLTQAVAAQAMLARRGDRTLVSVGVRTGNLGNAEAHAWLVRGGEVLLGGSAEEISSYRPLIAFDPSGAEVRGR
jgi:hypothetical protein